MNREDARRVLVAARQDGVLVVHLPGATGASDTLCSLDPADPTIGHESAGVPTRARVRCPDCIAIWRHVREFPYEIIGDPLPRHTTGADA